jgi:hypothetical protein
MQPTVWAAFKAWRSVLNSIASIAALAPLGAQLSKPHCDDIKLKLVLNR